MLVVVCAVSQSCCQLYIKHEQAKSCVCSKYYVFACSCTMHTCISHCYYLRVVFISLRAPDCAANIWGWHLIEEIRHIHTEQLLNSTQSWERREKSSRRERKKKERGGKKREERRRFRGRGGGGGFGGSYVPWAFQPGFLWGHLAGQSGWWGHCEWEHGCPAWGTRGRALQWAQLCVKSWGWWLHVRGQLATSHQHFAHFQPTMCSTFSVYGISQLLITFALFADLKPPPSPLPQVSYVPPFYHCSTYILELVMWKQKETGSLSWFQCSHSGVG